MSQLSTRHVGSDVTIKTNDIQGYSEHTSSYEMYINRATISIAGIVRDHFRNCRQPTDRKQIEDLQPSTKDKALNGAC